MLELNPILTRFHSWISRGRSQPSGWSRLEGTLARAAFPTHRGGTIQSRVRETPIPIPSQLIFVAMFFA